MKICTVIGARPQFIKHAAFEFALKSFPEIEHVVVHTGQHYDENMSAIFFKEFGLKEPDYNLKIGSGKHGEQTALMLIAIEKIILDIQPDYLLVYGDTNSTLAGALAAKKNKTKLIHIEAGLRSFNNDMPEEINRIITDRISDLLFVPSQLAINHLKNESIIENVFMSGDIMKDLIAISTEKQLINVSPFDFPYYYTTIHRPYNTDEQERLVYILNALNALDKKVVFSLHPRTKNLMQSWGMDKDAFNNIQFIDPVGYFDNLGFIASADALLTDSGGMQKEAYWVKTKCLTIRQETEWTETLSNACNELLFEDLSILQDRINIHPTSFDESLYGDGKAAYDIASKIVAHHSTL